MTGDGGGGEFFVGGEELNMLCDKGIGEGFEGWMFVLEAELGEVDEVFGVCFDG